MSAIRVIFNGTAFLPQQPVTLPQGCEAIVFVDQTDSAQQLQIDADTRAYYQSVQDGNDDEWAAATAPQSHRAWDED